MAEAFVSMVIEMLASNIGHQMQQEYRLVVGVDEEIEMLKSNLEAIKAVLADAERKQMQETIKLWLAKLKGISYDIDDVLDEWSTAILRLQIEGDDSASKHKKKVRSFILSACFCGPDVCFRHDIAAQIIKLNERLDVIAKEKDRYNLSFIQGNEQVERNTTTSFVDVKEVKGRVKDKDALINLLLAESSVMPNLHVISVVGMGGIGKTTLARLVYDDDRIKSHFQKKMWFCVSDPFDEIGIAKAILQSLMGAAPDVVGLQALLEKIQHFIEGKKFLLVLDDVWNEDFRKWEQLKHCIECGAPGSKILVTTRKENVAKIMGSKEHNHIIRLGLLSEPECWSIFSQVAFSDRTNEEKDKSLEEIGRKIVARCKGLPLAVKTMGGLLRFKDSVQQWQSVLDSELWKLEEVERDVLVPLWLSYYDLPSTLKQCFLHCVIFPKDHRLSRKKLVGMWMSQGYLRAATRKDMVEIGEEYFQHLAMRSLFQDFEEDGANWSNICCKMHDLVHDFGQLLMKKESCSIEVNSTTNRIDDLREDLSYNQIRHAGISVVGQCNDSFPSCVYNFRTLRSLIILSTPSSSMIEAALPCIFHELTCLRSLSLSSCGIEEIPSNIGELIHLRELDLSWNSNLKKLPETLCKLYNLQTLIVDKCRSLESLPQGMGKLINLNCLYNFRSLSLWLPKGTGRLSNLRRLSWINIGHDNEREETCLSLRDVENLNNLGGYLGLNWIRQHKADVDVKDAKQAQLKAKKHLTELDLFFSEKVENVGKLRKGGDEELLEALEPPPNLKCLGIFDYHGIKICSTSWITWKLNSLRKLVLSSWINCEQLPALGNLSALESLKILRFESVKKVGGEFLGMDGHDGGIGGSGSGATDAMNTALILFPKLMELEFYKMKEWEEWNYEEDEIIKNIIIMPTLRSLSIGDCRKFEKLPHYITQNTSLKLEINGCPALIKKLKGRGFTIGNLFPIAPPNTIFKTTS